MCIRLFVARIWCSLCMCIGVLVIFIALCTLCFFIFECCFLAFVCVCVHRIRIPIQLFSGKVIKVVARFSELYSVHSFSPSSFSSILALMEAYPEIFFNTLWPWFSHISSLKCVYVRAFFSSHCLMIWIDSIKLCVETMNNRLLRNTRAKRFST